MQEFDSISRIARSDLQLAMARIAPIANAARSSREYTDALDHELKILVRSFFALVEAESHAMRVATWNSGLVHLEALPERDRRDLGTSLGFPPPGGRNRRVGALTRFRLALQYFPMIFGSDFSPSFEHPGWQALIRLVRIRNRMTHPSRLEHLFPAAALSAIPVAAPWYLEQIERELLLAIASTSKEVPVAVTSIPASVDQASILDPDAVFSHAFYEQILQSGSRSIAYVREVHRILGGEMKYSTDAQLTAMDKRKAAPTHFEFALRSAARCLIGVAEGMSGMALFLLTSYARRGEIDPALEPAGKAIWRLPPAPRLRKSLELFSETFGFGHRFDVHSPRWLSFEKLVEIRDRLTHPDSAHSLMVDIGTLTLITATVELLGADTAAALTLNQDRV